MPPRSKSDDFAEKFQISLDNPHPPLGGPPNHHFLNYIADLFWKSEVLVIFTTIIIIF